MHYYCPQRLPMTFDSFDFGNPGVRPPLPLALFPLANTDQSVDVGYLCLRMM